MTSSGLSRIGAGSRIGIAITVFTQVLQSARQRQTGQLGGGTMLLG